MGWRRSGLLRNQDFLRLWSGQTVSVFGTLIGSPALSFAAILTLHATPFQMGLLAAARGAPSFILGLPAGAWVDRLRRRPLMIAADLGRAVLLATIPLAAWLGLLRMGQLYVIAFLTGVLTVFFDVSYQSYLPALVRREELAEANSKLQGTESIAEIGGFGVAGVLIQLLTAPTAILVDALSFLGSALCIGSIRRAEPAPVPAHERESVRRELVEGLQAIVASPLLRALAGGTATLWFAFGLVGSLITLFSNRILGIAPGPLGLIWCVGGVSSLAGAFAAGPVTRRFGLGPTLVGTLALTGVFTLFIPLAAGAIVVVVVCLALQQLLGDFTEEIHSINEVSLRQAVTPDRLLGRVNACSRFLQGSAQLGGALVGGTLGELIGVRTTLYLGCTVLGASALWYLFSPVRALRTVPELAVAET